MISVTLKKGYEELSLSKSDGSRYTDIVEINTKYARNIGEDTIKEFMLNNRAYYISSLIGLIPNCASSVIMTEIYLSGMISFGSLISGLLTGAGVGLLILFKTNKNIKENIMIIILLYVIGVIFGYLIDLIGVVV